ncbi:MAG: hypothetical protein V1820_00690 [archaeon]
MGGNLVNKIQLPIKCSKCGNKMFRAQYTQFMDRHIHSLDYCPECDKETDYKLMKELASERNSNRLNRALMTIVLLLGAAVIALFLLEQLGIINLPPILP